MMIYFQMNIHPHPQQACGDYPFLVPGAPRTQKHLYRLAILLFGAGAGCLQSEMDF